MLSAKILRISLFLFLLCFPKGGFKIHELPITWGYLSLLAGGFIALFKKSWRPTPSHLICLLAMLPFWLSLFSTFLLYGTAHIGYTLSLLISFLFLPLLCFLTPLTHDISRTTRHPPIWWIENALFVLALYGIALFFFKLITGQFIEIPYLTINGADRGLTELKSIQRGDFFKLISTYNNGNLYGICLLMLLPLIEKSHPLRRFTIQISLVLTLSRTVWAGLIFHHVISLLTRRHRTAVWPLLLTLTALLLIAHFLSLPGDFFWDATLGGRDRQLTVFENLTLFGGGPFVEIKESVYLGILEAFGILGLISFLLALIPPIILNPHTPTRLGLINYLFVSLSDGALLFIPTMAFFWILASYSQPLARQNA